MSLMTALLYGGQGEGRVPGTRTRPLGGSVEPLFCSPDATRLGEPLPSQGQLPLPGLLTQAPAQLQRAPLA